MSVGNRIIVLGCPGSGKSTFARALQAKKGLPLIHLDSIWWRADRTHISTDEFDHRLAGVLTGERWIIDGNYSRTFEARFQACDTVFFLDYDEETCMQGIVERIGRKRTDIPWVEDKMDPELVAFVRDYSRDCRPAIYALLEKYADRQAFVFKSRSEADCWLYRE